MNSKTKQVSIYEVEHICYFLAKTLLEWNEPIPEFTTRYPGILESCLMTPFSTYGKKHLYRGLWEKSAILFYLMIKNHPFKNGNKRIALMTLNHFLYKNGYELSMDPDQLYKLSKDIAESNPKVKAERLKLVAKEIKINVVGK